MNIQESIAALRELGYAVTNEYNDGGVRLAKTMGDKRLGYLSEVHLFVSRDGNVTPPQTDTSEVARIELHEAKIKHRYYSSEQRERDAKVAERVAWLRETLIPDLHESGSDATAEDFEMCCDFLDQYLSERTI